MANTTLQDVYDSFLSKITDYDYLKLSEEDLNEELAMKLKSAIAKFIIADDIKINEMTEQFNRELSYLEIEILAYGMVLSWVEPLVNNVETMKQRLSSKDFSVYSQAKHLAELNEVRIRANREFNYWINRYSSSKALKEMME
ncbi:hypothetical protein [Clostridium sp.]|uniref:hypothetical protein n=1 Tax=Clostridium sp. TaxID=1506 RepID=UPI001B43D9FE|nr:hypothetical protein [Clostridium sp.]MBP3916378.1 hypothetical protein [Clostridium sp.]